MSRGKVAPWLLAAMLVGAPPARADVPPELEGRPIVEIEIAGEAAAIAEAGELGIATGTRLSRRVVREAIRRVFATGHWTDVQIDAVALAAGVRLVVWLTPRVELHRIQISGNEHVEERAILEALRVAPGAQISSERLDAFAQAVAARYAERGYERARATVTLRDTDHPSRKVLMVQIEEGAPTRIGAIEFDGERPLDPVPVLAAMGLGVDDVLDRQALADGVHAAELFLRELGYLDVKLGEPRVSAEGERVAIAIPSRIGPRYRLVVRGAGPFSQSEIERELELYEESLTRVALERTLPERVLDLYARYGFAGTEVRLSRLRDRGVRRAVLLVQIWPGKQLRVVTVSFAGARHFSREFLRDQVSSYLREDLPGSAIGTPVDAEVVDELHQGQEVDEKREIPAPLLTDPEQMFYAPTYDEATKHITELYQAEGFLEAKVGPAELQRIGRDRAAVNVPVVEGPRTMLHAVVLRGATTLSARELLVTSGLERGQPFSYLRLEEARLRMVELYHEHGHMFARVEPHVRLSGDRTRAEVEIQIVERFPVTVERVVIRGAERTSESFIRGLLKLAPGAIYRPSLARESEEEIASLGVFTGVSVELEDPDLPARLKPVVVTVNERHGQHLDFSAGVSTGQGVRAGFEYGYRNLFGHAVGLALRVQFAHQLFFVDDVIRERYEQLSLEERLERRVALGMVVPRPPLLGPVRTSVDLVHVRDNERDFGLDKNGVTLTFTHHPMKRVTTTLAGDLENNNVDLFVSQALCDYLAETTDPRLRRLLRVPEGSSTLVAGRTSVGYDRRDNAFTPTEGYFMSGSAEVARTLTAERPDEVCGGVTEFKSRFLKLSVTTNGYVPIVEGVVLAGQLRLGRIFHLTDDSKTYPNRAFFLGGVDTMRGYFQDEMIPQDLAEQIDPAEANSVVRSGDAFVLVRGELRFPIYGPLQGALFSDLGNLWADAANIEPFALRATGGGGLRLATPVGPVAIDYGILFQRRPELGEPFGTLHFSIGVF